MYHLRVRNVDQALPEGCRLMRNEGIERASRNGPVLQLPMPLATTYTEPKERVLFRPDRKANPFFHLYEAMWMLDGRRDVESLTWWNSRMSEFSDNGDWFHGAYGYRWRHHFGTDQLKQVIRALKANPDCRRQVIGQWDVHSDLGNQGKDLPCNTQIFVQVNPATGALDIMVTNRSNDMIWGAYGANAVHFSFLQEYLASSIGVEVGTYTQVSMNTHLYLDTHRVLMDKLADQAPDMPVQGEAYDSYARGMAINTVPLMSVKQGNWDRELRLMLECGPESCGEIVDPFLDKVFRPAWLSYRAFKKRQFEDAVKHAGSVASQDWMLAMKDWMRNRKLRWEAKQAEKGGV